MKNNPKVTVLIPTYNMAGTLSRALSSVLSQTYSPIELLVVDDGSTDETAGIISEFISANEGKGLLVRYIRQYNQGRAAALNAGIKLSTGDYVALLDADDTLTPESIELRVDYLEVNPGKDAVFANTNYMDNKGRVYHVRRPGLKKDKEMAFKFLFAPKVPFHIMTLMFARRVFGTVGYFDSSMRRAEDLDHTFRLLSKASVGRLDELTYNYYVDTHGLGKRLKIRISVLYSRLRLIRKNVREPVRYLLYLRTLTIEPLKLCWDVLSYKK